VAAVAAPAAAAHSKPGVIHGSRKKAEAVSPAVHIQTQHAQKSGQLKNNQLIQQRAKSKQRLVNHNSHKLEPVTLKRTHQPVASALKNRLATKQPAAARSSAGVVSAKVVRKMEDRIAKDIVNAFKCTSGTGCLERSLTDAEKDAQKIFSGPLSMAKQQPSQHVRGQHNAADERALEAHIINPLDIPILGPEISVINNAESKHFWQEAAQIAEKKGAKRKTVNSAATFVKHMAAAARHDAQPAAAEPALLPRGPMSQTNEKTFK